MTQRVEARRARAPYPRPWPKKRYAGRLDSSSARHSTDWAASSRGGSGTPGHYFQSAARIGVNKININSDLRYAYRTTLEGQLAAHPDEYAIVKLIAPVIASVQAVVEQHIDLFGSTGKTQP